MLQPKPGDKDADRKPCQYVGKSYPTAFKTVLQHTCNALARIATHVQRCYKFLRIDHGLGISMSTINVIAFLVAIISSAIMISSTIIVGKLQKLIDLNIKNIQEILDALEQKR